MCALLGYINGSNDVMDVSECVTDLEFSFYNTR